MGCEKLNSILCRSYGSWQDSRVRLSISPDHSLCLRDYSPGNDREKFPTASMSFFLLSFCARRDFPSNLRPLTSFICCWNGETKMVDPRGISQLIQSIKLATSLDPFLQVLIWFQDWLRPSPFLFDDITLWVFVLSKSNFKETDPFWILNVTSTKLVIRVQYKYLKFYHRNDWTFECMHS